MEKDVEVYVASCFTGAHCSGVYSTLEKAQAAIEDHYRTLKNAPETADLDMRWVKVGEDFAWVRDNFKDGIDHPWFSNTTPDKLMEGCMVSTLVLDKPLPFV